MRDIFAFAGPFQTVAETAQLGGDFAAYEDIWTANEPRDWAEAATWTQPYNDIYSGGAVYDRPKMYYVWAERVEDDNPQLAAVYRERADAIAVSYRDHYAVLNPAEQYSQWYSIASHFIMTRDNKSRRIIGDAADRYAYYQGQGTFANRRDSTQRYAAHAVAGLLSAWYIGAPSNGVDSFPGGNNWAIVLPRVLNDILSLQDEDGGWRYLSSSYAVKAFQVGLMCGCLIDYYRLFVRDSAIVDAVKKAQHYLWENMLDTQNSAFRYLSGDNTGGGEPYDTYGAPDLNNFHLSSLGWLYHLTGDPTYKTRADILLARAVTDAYVSGYKQLSEFLHSSYKYMWYRSQTPLASPSVSINLIAPSVTGCSETLTCSTGVWSNRPTSFSYQWKAYDAATPVANVGMNQSTFIRTAAEDGKRIYCIVTASNRLGVSVPARSNETGGR